MPKFLLVIILVLMSFGLHAQTWEIGGFGGGAGYMGDLNQNNPLKVSGVSWGAFIKRNFDGYLAARVSYMYGNIAGADSTLSNLQQRQRNLSFRTQISELSLTAEFNFMKYIPSMSHDIYTPYIYVGLGYTNFNPQAMYQGQLYSLQSIMTEGQSKPYSNEAFSIPYGAGFKYNFAGALTIAADIGYRNPNTDYLDDVSGNYADKTKITDPVTLALSDRSGEKTGVYLGTAGTQRGDLRKRDTYMFIGFSISYTFITSKCYYER